jgi:2-hydroxychromene-2-carboxylate isomerase
MSSLTFDLFWSMRSPYSYLALNRIIEIQRNYEVEVNLRVVYPIAIRDPEFFKVRASKHYRPYLLLDSARLAEYYDIPFRRPIPDPVVQDLTTSEISDEQPYIYSLTRLAALASEKGKGLSFLDQVARLLWDGQTDNWDQGQHLAKAIERAGLDADGLMNQVSAESAKIDTIIFANQASQTAAGHGGVPLMVFKNEPFFGQDRIDLLLWRIKQNGLTAREHK